MTNTLPLTTTLQAIIKTGEVENAVSQLGSLVKYLWLSKVSVFKTDDIPDFPTLELIKSISDYMFFFMKSDKNYERGSNDQSAVWEIRVVILPDDYIEVSVRQIRTDGKQLRYTRVKRFSLVK